MSNSPAKHWSMTLNNYNVDHIIEMMEWLSSDNNIEKYCIQEEIGELNGVPHLQGFVSFRKKIRWSSLDLDSRWHWEKARNKKALEEYCAKDATHVGARWTNVMYAPKMIDPMEGKVFKDWQNDLLEMFKQPPHQRLIHWFWDAKGGCGKTSFCKHICMHKNAILLDGGAAHMKDGIRRHIEKHKFVDIVFLNIPRTKEEFVSYAGIESVKDGIFFNNRYEGEMCLFNPPHFVVFANTEPKYEALSGDRWDVRNISDPMEF